MRGPAEYWGAVELPVPNIQVRDSVGRVFVTLDVNADTSESTLLLFFNRVGLAPNTETFAAHFDFDRWASDPAVMSNSDRRFLINLDTGATSTERPTTIFGTTLWRADAVTEPLYQAAATCVPAAGAVERRCDIEMAIPLPPDALSPPTEGLAAGVGFAVSDSIRGAALPEELSSAELTPFDEVLLDRSEYISLIFTKPKGVPFTFLSWNVAHWGSNLEWQISGSPFEPIAISQLAEVMYPYDIIAIQEMWDRDDAIGLRNTVNTRRAAAGLPPMQLIGPASHPPAYIQLFGGGLFGDGHAGLFILSRFPVIGQDSTGYEDCRGEDCFKPKGVQWARLALRTPTAEDLSSDCRQHVPGSSCPNTPTSEMYIDVFNTHMQARNPQLCDLTPNDRLAYWAVLFGGCEVVPIPGVCEALFTAFQSVDANCDLQTEEEVASSQIAQMASFVESVVGDDTRHPAILAGDFNINGRRLHNDTTAPFDPFYAEMLDELGLIPVGGDPSMPAPSDRLSPFPNAFVWDIDHSDVARERVDLDWVNCGHGTSVGTGSRGRVRDWTADGTSPDPAHPECLARLCDNYDDRRIDYISIRPPVRPETSTEPPSYLITRSTAPGQVWEPLWPAVGTRLDHLCSSHDGVYTGPRIPDQPFADSWRISDHRPVLARFELTPLRVPGRYHPAWDHELNVRVTSIDATGRSDCWLGFCGPAEPYLKLEGWRFLPGSGVREPAPGLVDRGRCSGWSVSVGDDPCSDDWQVTTPAPAGAYTRHEVTWRLFEADASSPDDHYATVEPPSDPTFKIDWGAATFDIDTAGLPGTDPGPWPGPTPILSSDRWCHTTRPGLPNLSACVELREVP